MLLDLVEQSTYQERTAEKSDQWSRSRNTTLPFVVYPAFEKCLELNNFK